MNHRKLPGPSCWFFISHGCYNLISEIIEPRKLDQLKKLLCEGESVLNDIYILMKYDYMLASRIFSISEGWLIAERWRTFITVECDKVLLFPV